MNPHSIQHGWVAWDSDAGGAPVSEVMVPASRPLPEHGSLPALPQGLKGNTLQYKPQRSVQLVCVLDPAGGKDNDEGTLAEYKQSSTGAMRLFKDLTEKLLQKLMEGDDKIVPVVKLTSSSYKHDRYGKIINPVFEFVEWRAMNDGSKPAAVADEVADEEAELAAEYNAVAAEAETPRRRSRRD